MTTEATAGRVAPARGETRAQVAQSKRRRDRRNRILLWIAVVGIMVFCLFPFYWLLNTSLKTGQAPPAATGTNASRARRASPA